MSGKRLDIWGLPIEDDEGAMEAQQNAPAVGALSDTAEASDFVADGGESAIAGDAPGLIVDATIEEDELSDASFVAPVSAFPAPTLDEPSLVTASEPEADSETELPAEEVHTPDAVYLPPPAESATVAAISDSTQEERLPIAALDEDAPKPEDASVEMTAEELERVPLAIETVEDTAIVAVGILSADASEAIVAESVAEEPTAEEPPQTKPEKAWIPPSRRKQPEAENVDASSPVESAVKPVAVGEAITGASAIGGTEMAQASSQTPSAAESTAAAGADTGGYVPHAPPVTSAPVISTPTAAEQPVPPPALTVRYPAPIQTSTSPQSDDFWGVPPKPEAAQPAPAPMPAAPRPATPARPVSGPTNRSTSMPISNPLTAAAVAAAAPPPSTVGGLVPQNYAPPAPRATLTVPTARPAARVQSEGRIEVINPDGWKREFPLRRSILYVGSAAGSDILLPVAGIAPRHLQFVPSTSNRVGYRMINLGGTPVSVRGASASEAREVAPRASIELADGDRVEFGGYSIVFFSGEMSSQLIQVRLEVPNPRIELDRPLDGALYIRNGGDRAGVQFVVEVQGIDNRYIQIESGPVLFPDVEKRVAFRISHPRTSQPAAGDQPINFVVTAPEGYPGETAVASQVVSIAPFFAHKVRLIAIEPELSGYTLSTG